MERALKLLVAIFLISLSYSSAAREKTVVFVGDRSNDFYRTLVANDVDVCRYGDLDSALACMGRGDGLVVSAAGYPEARTGITDAQWARIRGVRAFVEFPQALGNTALPHQFNGKLERAVVTSPFFGRHLPEMSVLGINGVTLADMSGIKFRNILLTYAKVAGFDYAQFGLEGTKAYPLLALADRNLMVAATSLTSFVSGRFGPKESWRTVMDAIAKWLLASDETCIASIEADPRPTYGETGTLPSDAYGSSIKRGADWLWNAKLLIHPTWARDYISRYQPEGGNPNHYFRPPIADDMMTGDGSFGVMEGHASEIYADGSQKFRYFIRADVQGESSMLLASAARICSDPVYRKTAENVLDYLFYTSDFRAGAKNDRTNPAYGLLGWANTHQWAVFNDDNARCILGVIGASSLMENYRWNRFVVENIFANFRTCSRQGFQGGSLDEREIIKNGWQYYNGRDFVNPHPHFESWMWACYLWLYDKCGFEPLLVKAKNGIRETMSAYPDGWHVQNGMQQERARMVLPLAWMYRLEPTEEHYLWLETIVNALLECQQPCGAIREELGRSDQDKNKILVSSNDAYGKNEAPLIAMNGDEVSDMLYTCNFLFFALNEAACATQNEKWAEAVSGLGDFLVRIQVASDAHKDLDGAWFRAFDYGRWDYWASNADDGWGAWSTLSGWIQSWIVSTEFFVDNDTSYWEQTKNMDMRESVAESMWMVENL